MSTISDYQNNLDRIEESIKKLSNKLDELQTKSHPLNDEEKIRSKELETLVDDKSRYLAILISGFLEVSIRKLVEDYIFTKAPKASNYISRFWPESKNMWYTEIVKIIKAIDVDKGNNFELNTKSLYKDDINQIVQARNKIAHGIHYTIVNTDVYLWLASAKKAVKEFDNNLNS